MRARVLRFTSSFTLALGLAFFVGAPASVRAACTERYLFRPSTYRTVGPKVNRVALVDLNHDGILDLVATTPTDLSGSYLSTISVLLGKGTGGIGNGTFGPPVTWPVGTFPANVAVANLDGDGNPDLVVGNWGSNSVSLLHGHADGTFAAPVNITIGNKPYTPVMADLNHDGILDLAVANNGAATVNVRLGLGGDNYGSPASYAIGDLGMSLVAADLNHDGNPDLIASAYSAGLSVLLGNANGTFQPAQTYPTGGEAYAVGVADLDGDGNLDVVVTNTSSAGVAVFLGNGLGGFGAPAVYAVGALNGDGLALADFDGDGIMDLAVSNTAGDFVVVLKGQGTGGVGDGTFSLHSSYPVLNWPNGLATGDLNGDGRPDLVVGGYGYDGGVSILIGACMAALPEAPHLVSVRDVPNDQGGHVFLRWTHSSLDTTGVAGINAYRVWRRLPLTAAAARLAAMDRAVVARASSTGTEYWEAIAELPAEELEGYGYTAATTQDSMPGSNPYTAFFVTALPCCTAGFYESNVDSGYSVDNLAPAAPAPFLAQPTPTAIALHWSRNREPDLSGYRLYRGATLGFVPGPQSLVAFLSDTGYTDPNAVSDVYYKLCAVDIHGNASPYSTVSIFGPVGTLASLVSVSTEDGVVSLLWSVSTGAGTAATVYRCTGTAPWQSMGSVAADGSGLIRFKDEAVVPGQRYGYCLGLVTSGGVVSGGETWVEMPTLRLKLAGARPNPANGDLTVAFTLPGSAPARLEVVDLAGRRVLARDVGSLGAGFHTLNLSERRRIPPGVYLLHLTQGPSSVTARAVVVK